MKNINYGLKKVEDTGHARCLLIFKTQFTLTHDYREAVKFAPLTHWKREGKVWEFKWSSVETIKFAVVNHGPQRNRSNDFDDNPIVPLAPPSGQVNFLLSSGVSLSANCIFPYVVKISNVQILCFLNPSVVCNTRLEFNFYTRKSLDRRFLSWMRK